MVATPVGHPRYLRHSYARRRSGSVSREEKVRSEYMALLENHAEYLGGKGRIDVQDKLLEPLTVQAFNLPLEVLRKIYYENAARLIS